MAFKTFSFGSTAALDRFLNGATIGGANLLKYKNYAQGRIQGLDGLTLDIDGSTVTFVDTPAVGLTFAEIKAAIEAATTDVDVSWEDGALVLFKVGGLVVAETGTANPIFGFSSATPTSGTVYAGPEGAAPRWVTINGGPRMDSYFCVTEQA